MSAVSSPITGERCKLWVTGNVFSVQWVKHEQGGHKPEKPGILRDFSERGKLREFSGNSVQPQGKL